MILADALAVLRAVALIPVAWALAADRRDIALAIFLVAALTDALDGWLARRASGLAPRGAFLDPIADKVLVVGTLIALAAVGSGWPATVVAIFAVAREGLVAFARARALVSGRILSADALAKAKTVIEMVGTALIVLGGRPWSVVGVTLVGVALLVGFVTLPRYFAKPVA